MLLCSVLFYMAQMLLAKWFFVPNMWQVVFAHISVEGRVVDSNVDGFLDGSGNAMSLSAYDLKIIH